MHSGLRLLLFPLGALALVACAQRTPAASVPVPNPTPSAALSAATPSAMPANMDPASMAPGMAHEHMAGAAVAAPADVAPDTIVVAARAEGVFGSGDPVSVSLHLTDRASGKPLGPEAFERIHTEKVHALGVDPSLTDYSHSHPAPGAASGDWTFNFVPRFNRPYHLWLDVTPLGGSRQYVMFTLNAAAPTVEVERSAALQASVGAMHGTLAFDAPLVSGQAAMGHLVVTRAGKPFLGLEPVMGAFSHIVGIADDWKTIAHVHPMGDEPTRPSDRGGPALDFHLEPARAGFLKLFAQVQVDGHDVFLPFGVFVAPPGSAAGAAPASPTQH